MAFPGPFPVSAHADRVEKQLLLWAVEQNLPVPAAELRALCGITSQGIARALPLADFDPLLLAAEFFLWLVAFDDTHGETTAAAHPAVLADHTAELTQALNGDTPAHPQSPFTTALCDLLERIQDTATPTQYLRLTGHLRDNLLGLLWEAHHLAAPEGVTLPTYCAMRPLTVFVRTLMAITPIALSYDLPDQQRRAVGPVHQLETAVAHLAGWVNDLASYQRETSQAARPPLSLPTLLMTTHRLTLRRAFDTAARMCEEQAAAARIRIDELTAGGSSPLARHAQAVEHVAHAFIWHVHADRYTLTTAASES